VLVLLKVSLLFLNLRSARSLSPLRLIHLPLSLPSGFLVMASLEVNDLSPNFISTSQVPTGEEACLYREAVAVVSPRPVVMVPSSLLFLSEKE